MLYIHSDDEGYYCAMLQNRGDKYVDYIMRLERSKGMSRHFKEFGNEKALI